MTYHTENKIRKYVQEYGFMSFAKKIGNEYVKKILNKGISGSKKIKNSAEKLNQRKYGKVLKKEAGKQLSGKIIPAAIDVAGSKIADKITSLKFKDNQEPQEEDEEIIIPLHQRQKTINDLRLF